MKNIYLKIGIGIVALPLAGAFATGEVGAKLRFTDKDQLFKRTEVRATEAHTDTVVTLWRGERGGIASRFKADRNTGRLAVRIENAGARELPKGFTAHFIDNLLTNSWQACGYPPDTLPAFEVADALVKPTASELSQGSVRYVWTTLDVPHDAAPGDYDMSLIVSDVYAGRDLDTLGIRVKVADRTLPKPADQKFYLDFWQQPYAISRYYGVKPWSDEHLELMRPYAQMLARAGQKAVTTILFYEPWGVQSNDKFEPMVETILGKDGKWRYDYTVFDRYVEFMEENGISELIECFSMIPWDMSFRYFDEGSGGYKYVKRRTSDAAYSELWTPFLQSFERHLKEKGWLDKTVLAIDERGLKDMQNAMAVAKKAAPGLKFSLAGNFHPEIADAMSIYTLTLGDPFPEGELEKRRERGEVSMYYTCCSSPEPNIFSNNDPIDAAYIPVFCTANGADGYLHWAFTNWTDNPLADTRFYMFAPGDTYCVYPDEGSSLRWERLIEGIQTSEKIRLLKEEFTQKGETEKLKKLEEALQPFVAPEPPSAAQRKADYHALQEAIFRL